VGLAVAADSAACIEFRVVVTRDEPFLISVAV
jgi:hypothetical protein